MGTMVGKAAQRQPRALAVTDAAALRTRASIHHTSFASIVIFALSTLDTGQLALASAAMVWNFWASIPGTFAPTFRCTIVIAKPASALSSVTVAVVSMD